MVPRVVHLVYCDYVQHGNRVYIWDGVYLAPEIPHPGARRRAEQMTHSHIIATNTVGDVGPVSGSSDAAIYGPKEDSGLRARLDSNVRIVHILANVVSCVCVCAHSWSAG